VVDFTQSKGGRQRSVSVSEQRRPLLLPQEVKELGKDREVIFYEGIRPILASKNRYYKDPNLKNRILPPPKSAIPGKRRPERAISSPVTSLNIVTSVEAVEEAGITQAPGPIAKDSTEEVAPQPKTREATLQDVERIESLTLDDFAADFSKVELPEGPLTEGDLSRAVSSFLDSLKER